MKKIILILLVIALIFTNSPVNAQNQKINDDTGSLDFSVFSEEFPNAFINSEVQYFNRDDFILKDGVLFNNSNNEKINKFISNVNNNSNLLDEYKTNIENGNYLKATITATAYVEELPVNINNSLSIVESKLLTYEDIQKIFIQRNSFIGNDENSYYKLTLRLNVFEGTYYPTRYIISGVASWSSTGLGVSSPAKGRDYMGFTWGGSFDYSNSGCVVESSEPNVPIEGTVVDYIPNSGIVWGFNELTGSLNYGPVFANRITIGTHLNKRTLTGNGNTTAISLKYIHNYEGINGSISISAGSDNFGGEIQLIGVNKQWSLAVSVSNLRY